MADHIIQVQIEKRVLPDGDLERPLLEAFSNLELRNPQFGYDWLSNLSTHALAQHEKAVIFVARSAADDFIACPMKLNSRSGQADALGNFYTSAYTPVISSNRPEKLFLALFTHLARVEKLSAITLSPLCLEKPLLDLISAALKRAGWKAVHHYFCFGNWIHEVGDASYQDYLASRPSPLKNTIVRRTRQFLDGHRGRLQIVEGGDNLERAIEQFVAVYNSSWKQAEPYPDFIPQLIRLAASRGWLRLGIASYDDKAVASQIWLVWGGCAYILKLAYDADFKQLSAGTVLTAHLMEHVIDQDSVATIDYLSGDDAYKKDWMSTRRECLGIAAYNCGTPRGGVQLAGHTLKKLLRKYGNNGSGETIPSTNIE